MDQTKDSIHPQCRDRIGCLILLTLAYAIGLPSSPATKPIEVNSRTSVPRDHYLFVGVDLFLTEGGKQQRINKLDKKNIILDTPERERISMKTESGMHWKMTTKVSANLVTISNLSRRPTHAVSRIKAQDLIGQQLGLQLMADQNLDRTELNSRDGLLNMGSSSGNITKGLTDTAGEAANEEFAIEDAVSLQDSIADAGFLGSATDNAEDQPMNAIAISFEISTDQTIADAYVFGTVVIRAGEEFRDVIFHEHLGEISNSPRKVSILKTDLPLDFEIKQSTIHVFNHGEEFATNHSEKRYDLTVDEAEEFVRIDHSGSHRRESTQAKPCWSLAPSALHAATRSKDFDYLVSVKVSDSGALESIESNQQILPDHVRDIVKQIVFLPALENGQPVSSTLSFNLSDFFKE